MKYVRFGTAVLAGILVAACASAPPPHDRAAAAEASVRSAQEAGAREVPQASLYLQLAQDQLEKGKALMQKGDNKEARAEFVRSQADAELASAMTSQNKSKTAAQQSKARAEALKSGAPGSAVGGGPSRVPPPANSSVPMTPVTPPRPPGSASPHHAPAPSP